MTIEDAQHDASNASLEQIKHAAMAEVTVAHETISAADSESLKAQAGADEQDRKQAGAGEDAAKGGGAADAGNAEGRVAAELAGEIFLGSGAKIAQMGLDLFSDRKSDPGSYGGLKTMESDKKAMMRSPGVYNSSGASAGSKKGLWDGLKGKDKLGDINLAGKSITQDTESMAASMRTNASQITAQARVTKELTFSKEMASKQKFDNAHAIQASRNSGPGGPGGMGGGAQRTYEHNLAMGPAGPRVLSDEETAGAMA